jgi:hypothetical protein
VSGTTRFRVASDLIVGGQNFGTGVIPYLAVSQLATKVSQLAGTYDFMYWDMATGAPATTSPWTGSVNSNTLYVCTSTTAVTTTQACNPSSLTSYALTVDTTNDLFQATKQSGSQPSFSFYTGMVGAAPVILSAGTWSDGSLYLLVGVPDSAAIAGGTTLGSSMSPATLPAGHYFSGDWITMILSSSSYSFTGELGGSDSATLGPINQAGGPFSLETGDLASDNAPIYVMQAYPLSIAFGAPGGAASGLLQVTVP